MFVAEVACLHACGEHKVIPGNLQIARKHASPLDIESVDGRPDHRYVGLAGEDLPERGCDGAVVEHSGCQLVEERLKKRVIHSINQHHVRVGPAEGPNATHPPEPATDDHHVGASINLSDAAMR